MHRLASLNRKGSVTNPQFGIDGIETPPSPISMEPDPTPSAIGPSSPLAVGRLELTCRRYSPPPFGEELAPWLIQAVSDDACASFSVSAALASEWRQLCPAKRPKSDATAKGFPNVSHEPAPLTSWLSVLAAAAGGHVMEVSSGWPRKLHKDS